MLRGSDASDAEAEARRQAALGPPNELAVLAALSNADVIDVSGAEPIFDLLDTNGDGRLSAEELRQGVRSDAVVHYVRETGNAILKGLLRDRRGVGRALQEIDDSSGPFVSRRGWKRFVQAMAVERVRTFTGDGPREGPVLLGQGAGRRPDDAVSLEVVFAVPARRGFWRGNQPPSPSYGTDARTRWVWVVQVPARLPRSSGGNRQQPPGPLLFTGPGPPVRSEARRSRPSSSSRPTRSGRRVLRQAPSGPGPR